MIEEAVVVRAEGERVVLACQSQGCKSCSSFFCRGGTNREFEAKNPKGLPLKRADQVQFYVDPKGAIAAGFMVLVMPLLTFALAYFLVGLLNPGGSEQLKVLSGLGGLGGGFAVAYFFGRRDNRYPVVVAAPGETPDETISPTT